MVQCRHMAYFLCLFMAWGSVFSPAFATHETDHRFTIYGSVRDGSAFPGKPLPGKDVIIQDEQTGQLLQKGLTDQQGAYALLIHMHNSDLGRRIIVQSEGTQKVLELRFDPNDNTTERRARIDLIVFPK